MAVSVQIGDETVVIPVPNFALVKKAWPYIQDTTKTESTVIYRASAVIGIISVFLSKTRPDLTVETMEEKLTVPQAKALMESIPLILVDAGIINPPAEAPATGEDKPAVVTEQPSP